MIEVTLFQDQIQINTDMATDFSGWIDEGGHLKNHQRHSDV